MGVRVKDEGQFKEIYVKALDSLPVGTIVDYDGQASDIPTGWETYGTGQIKKTSETRPLASHTVNAYSESESNAYGCDYSNKAFGGVVLYENENGSNSNITLNQSASNFTYIDIFYKNQDNYHGFVRVYLPNGKAVLLPAISSYGAETYISNKNVRIQGTSINNVYSSGFYIQNNAVGGSTNSNNIYITRVIGYKTGLVSTQQSTRSLNTYSGDIEKKKDIVVDEGGEEKPIDEGNK